MAANRSIYNTRLVLALSLGLAAAVFWIDYRLPLAANAAALYVSVVVLSALPGDRRLTCVAAAGCILLAFGPVLAAGPAEWWLVVSNRGLTVFVIAITAFAAQAFAGRAAMLGSAARAGAAQLRRVETRTMTILQSLNVGIVVADVDGRLEFFNAAVERILGVGPTDVDVDQWSAVYGVYLPDGKTLWPADQLPLVRAMHGETVPHTELIIRNAQVKDAVWVAARAAPIKDEDGNFAGGVVIFDDVSDQKQSELDLKDTTEKLRSLNESLERFHNTDALTQTPNRRAFDTTIPDHLDRHRIKGTPCCLLMVDIDHFKRINDTLGHQAGDEALRKVAQCLSRGRRESDFIARYGGEEFAVVLSSTTLNEAQKVAERFRSAVAAEEHEIGGNRVRCTISIGLAEVRAADSVESLVRRADVALYAAKEAGRNCVCYYDGATCELLNRPPSKAIVQQPGMGSPAAAAPHAKSPSRDTQNRLKRIGLYSALLAEELGWAPADIEDLRVAASLLDVGEHRISSEILDKSEALTPAEFDEIKRHTVLGAELFEDSELPVLQVTHDVCLYHHEWWDGTGYPRGLAGSEIPESARIVAIVDVFDALTHDRPYRPAFTEQEALAILSEGRGKHFDPELLDRFFACLGDIRQVAQENPDGTDHSPLAVEMA